MRTFAIEAAVIMACYLIMTLPLTSATSVNIVLNGQTMETVEYDPTNIVNQNINYVRDPMDISWSNVRVAITLNSASLAHSIKRVYLYKCGSLSPVNCMQKTPEVFDNYVDTEIAWGDIGQRTGTTDYPQKGNLLFLVKVEDPEGLESWIGLWNTISRISHREFLFYRHELSDMDVHAESSYLVGPISSYIQNFNTIPFRWLTKAEFSDAVSISAIGGDDIELDSSPPTLQSVEPPSNEIKVINKENYFVFPETSSGIAFPITLEENPDFQCGDGFCESNLGESPETCCFDCGCEGDEYCDAPMGSSDTGTCKARGIVDLDIVGTPSAEVSECSSSFEVGITARVNNVPASMSEEVMGVVKIGDSPYAVQCEMSSPGLYDCSFVMRPTIECGSGVRSEGPNELKLTVNYMDGPNSVTTDLIETFPETELIYDCSCQGGYFCDTGTETCEAENAITLGITELTSYLDSYTQGDTIDLTAKIFNPPTGTVLVSASAGLNLTNGAVSPGTPDCTGPNEDYEYECSIPFSITGYQRSVNYRFFPNVLSFTITYNDGPDADTKMLSAEFGPISIPSQDCGNGVCNVDEDYASCCQDCGCEAADTYCDLTRGCSSLDGITLSVTPYPTDMEDCKIPNEVSLITTINNAPYSAMITYKTITSNSQPVPWGFECPPGIGGTTAGSMVFDCMLEIPPIEGCQLPYYTIGPDNRLDLSISFPNGNDQENVLTKDLSTNFGDIRITPIPHIDGECEADLGEDDSNACVDCPCQTEGYYCDSSYNNPEGTCLPSDDIYLVVENPDPGSTQSFDSCEEMNIMSVVMHVENQPSGMNIENTFATINESATGYVNCRELGGTYLESNLTINCSIGIPPVSTCTRNTTYHFNDNSISMVISYDNGNLGKVLKTLTADIPDVTIKQGYTSLYEILEEAKDELSKTLDSIMRKSDDLLGKVQACLKWQIAVAVISALLAIVLGFVGMGSPPPGGSKWRGFAAGAEAGGHLGTALTTGMSNICQMVEKWYQIQIKMKEFRMKQIEMDMCMSIAQHTMDSGKCRGNEEGCFSTIKSCLDFSGLNSILSEITGLADGIGKNSVAVASAFADAGKAIGEGPWGQYYDDAYLYVSLGSGSMEIPPNAYVCPYADYSTFNAYSFTTGQQTDLGRLMAYQYLNKQSYQAKNPCEIGGAGQVGPAMVTITKTHPKNCQYSYVGYTIKDSQDAKGTAVRPISNMPATRQQQTYTLNIGTQEFMGRIVTLYLLCSESTRPQTAITPTDVNLEQFPSFYFNVGVVDQGNRQCIHPITKQTYVGVYGSLSAYNQIRAQRTLCYPGYNIKDAKMTATGATVYTASLAPTKSKVNGELTVLSEDILCKKGGTNSYPYEEIWLTNKGYVKVCTVTSPGTQVYNTEKVQVTQTTLKPAE